MEMKKSAIHFEILKICRIIFYSHKDCSIISAFCVNTSFSSKTGIETILLVCRKLD